MGRCFDLGVDLDGYVHENGHVRRCISGEQSAFHRYWGAQRWLRGGVEKCRNSQTRADTPQEDEDRNRKDSERVDARLNSAVDQNIPSYTHILNMPKKAK